MTKSDAQKRILGGKSGGAHELDTSASKKIDSIHFGIFGETDITNVSEFQVVERNLYKLPERKPLANGVLDPRLGISDRKLECETCKGKLTDCAGHFGYIKLELPVFHIGYFKHVLSILQCICKTCSKVLLSETERMQFLRILRNPRLEINQRVQVFKRIVERCKRIRTCPFCESLNGAVKKVPMALKISHDKYYKDSRSKDDFLKSFTQAKENNEGLEPYLNKTVEVLNALRVWEMLSRINAEDSELLNITGRAEKLMMSHIPVPPVCIRPSIEMEMSSATNEDDITMKLITIVECNNNVRQNIEKGFALSNLMESWDFLQIQCAMYINSELPGIPQIYHGHKPLRGFVQRLKGKQGRFRGNLSGKRVDFSGRTVITPDPNLAIDEVAIPFHIAQSLTYPERVTAHNMKKLKLRVMNGVRKHPGASFVLRGEKKGEFKTYLKYGNTKAIAEDIQIGDIVERHLEDGDIVLFNRQPSLHKMSIMAHRVRVMPWRTFRFNECVCTPYNADFDGDEMNLHVPQTEEARTEAIVLMGVAQNLCSPKNGELIVAATQDFLTSAYLITKKDVFFDRTEFSRLVCYITDASSAASLPPPAVLKPIELWTGKQLFSMIIRESDSSLVSIDLELAEKTYSKKSKYMCPVDGWVCIQKSVLMCGNLGKATLGSGNKDGLFTLLIRDYNAHVAMRCMNRLAKLSGRWLGTNGFSIGIDDVTPSTMLLSGKERVVHFCYDKCKTHIDLYNTGGLSLQPGCDQDQTLEVLVSCELNKIREEAGKMCLEQLNWRNSALRMAQCGSKGSPLNISQMVACVGQQTVNGQRIGYGFKDRTLPHFQKHAKTPNARGFVKSSFYSGMSPTEFFFHTMAGREGLVDTAVKTAETGYMSRRLMKAMEDLAIQYDDTARTCTGIVVQFTFGDDSLDPVEVETRDGKPIDFSRILEVIRARVPSCAAGSLLPKDIKTEASKQMNKAIPAHLQNLSHFQNWLKSWEVFVHELATNLHATRERIGLSTKKKQTGTHGGKEYLASLSGLSKEQLTAFVKLCIAKYEKKRVEPGTAVGAVAAHSIGEPGTQMTLKTFHFAGVASMNVTLGVPRLKEIINASKIVSTPIMKVAILDPSSIESARIVKGRLEKTTLGDIAHSITSVLSPTAAYLKIVLDLSAIRKMQLTIDAYSVQDSILTNSKLKIKAKDITVFSKSLLTVYPRSEEGSNVLFGLQSLCVHLPQLIVGGISSVERAVISQVDNQHSLVVEGLNLRTVMSTEGVDFANTTSNHIIEVEKTLGIEASRQCIIKEIQYTMGEHGIAVDGRHLMLLADLMTNRGEVLGITRFGIAKMKDSVLMLASFEKTTDHLFNAALHNRTDNITGVSECIIMGRPMPIGTGLCKLLK